MSNMNVLTNTWTPISHGYPPFGRPVLVRLILHLPCLIVQEQFIVAIFNGYYWIDPLSMTTTPLLREGAITHWYMYEKFNTNNEQ